VENYAHSRVVFMNVDNIHTMRDSLKTVFDLLRTGKGDRWLSSLDSTRWLEHLRLVLSGGARVWNSQKRERERERERNKREREEESNLRNKERTWRKTSEFSLPLRLLACWRWSGVAF
jgi:hypothetical protein